MEYRKTKNAYTGNKNKLFLDTVEAWSYGWWKYVTKERGLVIFNEYKYSRTTSGHQSETMYLLKKHKIKVDVFVESGLGLQNSDWTHDVLTNLNKTIFLSEYRLARKGLSKDNKKQLEQNIKSCKETLKKLKRFKVKLSKETLKNMRISIIYEEEERLNKARNKAREYRAKRKAIVEANKTALNSLEHVSLYDKYDVVNNLESI